MTNLSRRRILQAGPAGLGLGLFGTASAAPAAGTDSTRVRMSGDGLGLTVSEQARLLSRLADEGRIARDNYSNGGVVAELEEAFAAVLGKERAVFMPTGTLANQLAVRALAGPGGGRAILQAESHLYNDSGDCVQTLSQIPIVPLGFGRAAFTLDEVKDVVERTAGGRVARPVRVISIETPVRRKSGETFPQPELDRITGYAKEQGIRLHLDGARLFLQSACSGVDVAETARPFDTVYVSLYKYFNAPSGAILAGPRALLDGMFHTRRMFGAGLPAAWPYAAIPLHYLPGFVARFRQAVETSESFIRNLGGDDRFSVERITPGTNLFRLQVAGARTETLRTRLRDQGVDLPAPRSGGAFLLGVNETWNRAAPEDLAHRFRTAAD